MSTSKYQYQFLGGLGRTLIVLLYFDIGLTGVSMASDFMEIGLLNRLVEGGDVSQAELDSNDMRQGLLGLLILGYLLVLLIAFGKWIYRSAANAYLYSQGAMTTTPGWCIGWYFIPFANLVKPYQAMKEIWLYTVKSHPNSEENEAPGVLKLWWGLWLLNGVIGQVAFRVAAGAETYEQLVASDYIALGGGVASIMLSLTAISMVRRLTALQVQIGEPGVQQDSDEICPECGEPIGPFANTCPMCGAIARS